MTVDRHVAYSRYYDDASRSGSCHYRCCCCCCCFRDDRFDAACFDRHRRRFLPFAAVDFDVVAASVDSGSDFVTGYYSG